MPTLATLRPAHPRLLFTPELEQSLHARLESDPLLARFVAELRGHSDHLAQAPAVPFVTVPFAEFGYQMLEVSRAILQRITLHGFFYRLTRERTYADRVWREVETALAYPTWNPAHFLDAAEMLLAMASAYDWMFDAWTPAQRTRLRTAMIERAIKRGLEIYEKGTGLSSFFVKSTANWNSVCNAGLLAATLAIAEEEPDVAQRVVSHALASLVNPQHSYDPDGASEEGATYWGYGTDFFCVAALLLQSALGHDGGLLDTPAVQRTALYRLHVQGPTGRNFQYADCWPSSRASLAYAFMAQRFGPPPARAHVRELIPDLFTLPISGDSSARLAPLIALWLSPPASAPIASAELDAFFGGRAHLAMMRSAWNEPRAAYVGFKAGNALHNHSHLDLGSFVFDCAGVRWSSDLGPDNYGLPGYFRSERNTSNPLNEGTSHLPNRWTYLRNNNHGHSTLTIGGALQSREAVAPFIDHGSSPHFAFAVADLSTAYPDHATHWHRGAALVRRHTLVIRDEITGLRAGTTVEWALMTEAAVQIGHSGRDALLSHQGAALALRIAAGPGHLRLHAAPARPKSAEENQNHGITQLTLSWESQETDADLEVHLIPLAHRDETGGKLGRLVTWASR